MASLAHPQPSAPAPRTGAVTRGDLILDDLRAFAKALGIAGASAMDREELVESLRQRYVLESMLHDTSRPRARNERA